MKWLTAIRHLSKTVIHHKHSDMHKKQVAQQSTDASKALPQSEKATPRSKSTAQVQTSAQQTPNAKDHHKELKRFFTTMLKLVMVSGLTYLAWHGYLSQFWNQLIGQHIHAVNQIYLAEARRYTEHLLEILTESKMILSLLQSSSGGISFIVDVQLQVGQTLSSLNDALGYAWKISLASLSAIELLSLSLDLSQYSMTAALTLCFILLGLSIAASTVFNNIGAFFHKVTKTCVFTVTLTHFIIPAAIFTSAIVSQDLFSNHRNQIFQSYSNFHSTLPGHDHGANLKDQVHNGINYYKDNRSKMHEHTHHLTRMSARHIIVNLLEYLVMPLLIVYLLSRMLFFGGTTQR